MSRDGAAPAYTCAYGEKCDEPATKCITSKEGRKWHLCRGHLIGLMVRLEGGLKKCPLDLALYIKGDLEFDECATMKARQVVNLT